MLALASVSCNGSLSRFTSGSSLSGTSKEAVVRSAYLSRLNGGPLPSFLARVRSDLTSDQTDACCLSRALGPAVELPDDQVRLFEPAPGAGQEDRAGAQARGEAGTRQSGKVTRGKIRCAAQGKQSCDENCRVNVKLGAPFLRSPRLRKRSNEERPPAALRQALDIRQQGCELAQRCPYTLAHGKQRHCFRPCLTR